MKLKFIIAAIASASAIGFTAWWFLKPSPEPAIAFGSALQALASPSEPDPEWLTNQYWIGQKFCADIQGNIISPPTTDDLIKCAGQPAGRGGGDSLNQMLIWTERWRQNTIRLEAQRLIAKAFEFSNQPGHPCHGKPIDHCYQSFEANLIDDIQKSANDPAQLSQLIGKAQALAIARSGNSPQSEPVSTTQVIQGVERYSQDLENLRTMGIDGVIGFSKDIQEAIENEQNQP